jgi:hypothetical protein
MHNYATCETVSGRGGGGVDSDVCCLYEQQCVKRQKAQLHRECGGGGGGGGGGGECGGSGPSRVPIPVCVLQQQPHQSSAGIAAAAEKDKSCTREKNGRGLLAGLDSEVCFGRQATMRTKGRGCNSYPVPSYLVARNRVEGLAQHQQQVAHSLTPPDLKKPFCLLRGRTFNTAASIPAQKSASSRLV